MNPQPFRQVLMKVLIGTGADDEEKAESLEQEYDEYRKAFSGETIWLGVERIADFVLAVFYLE